MKRLQLYRFIFIPLLLLLLALSGCQAIDPITVPEPATAAPVTITILNTSDEHGWLQPFSPFGSAKTIGGAANLQGWWAEVEDVDPDTLLVLSGGDNWTGPSISTWFGGEPMIEVFNQMGYHASAIGNHEFDFGRAIMATRFAAAAYPYLAANVRDSATGELADFAEPYALFDRSGVTVGVIGLITTDTATTTHPKNIDDLTFAPYAETVDAYIPQMIADGAELIVVLSHVCMDELTALARQTSVPIHAMFAGHCNEFDARMIDGTSIMGSGARFASYARLDITYDPTLGEVVAMTQALVPVEYTTDDGNPITPNPAIAQTVATWQQLVDEQLNEPIGYTATEIPQRTPLMANLVTDAWLWAYPSAQIAITNWGGFRAPIPAGEITWGTVIDVLPFDNHLTTVAITGEQLMENLRCCGGAVGGIHYRVTGDDVEVTLTNGTPFDPTATYTVITNDFMYAGGDDYRFGAQDPAGYDTNIHWRQPVIDYLLFLASTEAQPLDTMIDETVRAQ